MSFPILVNDRLWSACTQAVSLWGSEEQWRIVQEECCELGADINRFHRGRIDVEKLAEEVADVTIMMVQARLMLGHAVVDAAVERKLARLEKRITESQAKRG